MYRKSSKGNPYHDSLGRFTSVDGKGKGGIRGGDRNPQKWSSYGEVHKVDKLSVKDREKLDIDVSTEAGTDGRRHYHNQSIKRENHARRLAHVSLKGMTKEEARKSFEKAYKDFEKSVKPYLSRGGEIKVYRNRGYASFQIVQPSRFAKEVSKNGSVIRDTSTGMKAFHGHAVVDYKNGTVRSCRKGATIDELERGIDKYTGKHKGETSKDLKSVRMWSDDTGRTRFMVVQIFKSKKQAEEYAKANGLSVMDLDDGDME